VVFNTGPYTDLPDNSILITANMQSETGFPSSHQLKSYVASKSRPKLAARAVLSADAGLLVLFLTVEAPQGKMCQNSPPSGGGRSLGAKSSGGRGCPPASKLLYIDTARKAIDCAKTLLLTVFI